MKIKRPPVLFRLLAFLSRKSATVRFGHKVLARFFDFHFDNYIRGKGYTDIVTLHGNTKMFLWLDEHVDIIIWWQGFYEKFPSLTISKLLSSGDGFVDVGANIGYYSLLASNLVGEHGSVLSLEPVSRIFTKLLLNTSGHSNITAIQAAAGQENGTTQIYIADKWCTAGSRISAPIANQPIEIEEIKLIKLDDKLAGQKVDVIKIDVEGYEMSVLRGMEKIIQNNSNVKIFIEVNKKLLTEGGSSPDEVFNFLKSHHLQPWQLTYKNRQVQLLPHHDYWGDENLILFARKESLPLSIIVN